LRLAGDPWSRARSVLALPMPAADGDRDELRRFVDLARIAWSRTRRLLGRL